MTWITLQQVLDVEDILKTKGLITREDLIKELEKRGYKII